MVVMSDLISLLLKEYFLPKTFRKHDLNEKTFIKKLSNKKSSVTLNL